MKYGQIQCMISHKLAIEHMSMYKAASVVSRAAVCCGGLRDMKSFVDEI